MNSPHSFITLWEKIIDRLIVWSILLAFRMLRPFCVIKIGLLDYQRIGHLIPSTECWLRMRTRKNPNPHELHVFFCGKPPNRQILTMIQRKLRVWEGTPGLRVYDALKRSLPENSPIYEDITHFWRMEPAKLYELWNNVPPQLSFTKEELRKGEKLLQSMGITPGEPFVCFHARDRKYLEQTQPYQSPVGWSHHDFRDSDIQNYLPAAEILAERGCWVLRMGSVVDRPVQSKHPRVIDYATAGRSDFGDAYLMSHCKFFLGTAAGIYFMAAAFGVPCAWANVVPLAHPQYSRKDFFIPKKYRRKGETRFLTFREIVAVGADRWGNTGQFQSAGIDVVENTPEEILELAVEMDDRLSGIWKNKPGDEDLQTRYQSLFPSDHPSHGFPSRVGASFLRQNPWLLS